MEQLEYRYVYITLYKSDTLLMILWSQTRTYKYSKVSNQQTAINKNVCIVHIFLLA